mgnify:CR=1 FL=1
MATQEEVLKAIIDHGGYANLKQLKEYFGLPYSGSSWLPQRLRSLINKGLVHPMRIEGMKTWYFVDVDLLDISFRGRPAGTTELKASSLMKLYNFIKRNGIVTWRKVWEELNWRADRLNKYLQKLIDEGLVMEVRVGRVRLLTTPDRLSQVLDDYYARAY